MIMVSVIMPVYNAEKYIKGSLDSVLNQTMQNLEVICIDDGSTDHSLYILQEYQKADSRIKVLTQENQGSGPARNRGMKQAHGKYIAFLDADDFWHDEFVLETIVNATEKISCNVTGTFWGYYKSGKYERSALHGEYFEQGKSGKWIDFRDEQNCYNYGSYLFKKEFLMDNNILFPAYYRFQDPPFLTEALVKAQNYYVIPVDWYCYRTVYKRALSTFGITTDYLKGVIRVLEMAEKYHLQKLFEEMVVKLNAVSPYVISGIIQGNTELLVLLDKVKKYVADKNTELVPLSFIRTALQNQCRMIMNAFRGRIKDVNRLIIYGAGYYGNLLFGQLQKSNVDLEIVFAETEHPRVDMIEGRRCLWIDELAEDKENSFVIVAVIKETQPALISNIKRLGFKNFICLDSALMTALECIEQGEVS